MKIKSKIALRYAAVTALLMAVFAVVIYYVSAHDRQSEFYDDLNRDMYQDADAEQTAEEVEGAARAAQAHDFIMSFPKGYDTVLGRGGVNVSGGQKQRLCIARALLRRPKVLILDDSTSAVDSETEALIRTGLATFLRDTTVLTITQRVHTMQASDLVLVLDDGGIEAFGPPAELMKTSEVYREIYHSQQANGND